MHEDLVYVVSKKNHSIDELRNILLSHPEIKFASLVGIDIIGNDTDEKIPMKLFLEDIEKFLKGSVQTDGSSVVLPGICTLDNAKVDMVADLDVDWFVDYNLEHMDFETGKPVGTLRIPCFLYHDNVAVDSRHILKKSVEYFSNTLLSLLKENQSCLSSMNICFDDIEEVCTTAATELEFWVKTPNDKAEVEELSTSQVLQEQYWTRTKGVVRTSMEQSLMLMEKYGLSPEMGHKEVGGIKAKIDESGKHTHIMEQLEIDWKYSSPLQASDNELLVRTLIKETFRRNGLDVTFLAKPMDGVAGSGEHTHIGVSLKLKDGKRINLFTTPKKHFLSTIGYGAIMGILKNYEVLNPVMSSTNDALRRLKPGFEAPVCIVTSIGRSVDVPSRNRTILVGVIRDLENPFATRFELRSPNPHTNTYLAIATMHMAMIDGIKYALANNKTEDDLLDELSKKPHEDADYLEKERAYRSEDDVFECFSDEERNAYFGKAPATVYENMCAFDMYPEKTKVLTQGDVFTDVLIRSFRTAATKRWLIEMTTRIINNYIDEIRTCKMLHSSDKALDLDVANWSTINELRYYIMKDTYSKKSLFTRIKNAIDSNDLEQVSTLQLELTEKIETLRSLYTAYQKNLLDI